MEIKGELIGCNTFTSKKGTDCFFASLATPFDTSKEPNGIGGKVINMAAFGSDAIKLYKSIMDNKMCCEDVSCTGMFSNGIFNVLDISRVSKK